MGNTDLAENVEAMEAALDPVVKDYEIDDALHGEGIFQWGPDGERFERMFAIVMRNRRQAIKGTEQ